MLRVALLMPVAKRERGEAAVDRWKPMGYEPYLFLDHGTQPVSNCNYIQGEYKGVWHAINDLAEYALTQGVDVCVYAGDDMDPDPRHSAQLIGEQFLARFPDGFGVMQPCGDMQGIDHTGKPAARRIAGSAWFGKGWIKRAYQGKGPTWDGYWHFYADEELPIIAEIYNVMWWRPDLTQKHWHWSWGHMRKQDYHAKNQKQWPADKALFEARQKENFPSKEPLEEIHDLPR